MKTVLTAKMICSICLAVGCALGVSTHAMGGESSSQYASSYLYAETGADIEANERAARVQAVAEDRDSVVQLIVSTWSAVIEDRGGHPSQLESTLQDANAETLMRVSEAVTLAEINAILRAR